MNNSEKIDKLIVEKNGILTTKELEEAGISRQTLPELIKKGKLERIRHGTYISPDILADEMYAIHLRSDKIVFSNETALFLHDLTDRDPLAFTVTVPRGYGTGRLRDSGISVVTVMPDMFDIGVTKEKTIHGREISVYDLERTICDIIKARGKMDKDTYYNALKRYAASNRKDINKLMNYAKRLNLYKQVREEMEGFLV
jgi:predicted transcriptional regulator of viral defense system